MNILLVGSKCRFLQLLTDKLDKEGHRVFLLTAEDKSVRTSKKIFESIILHTTIRASERCLRECVRM